jgi:hypothetical protein
MTHPDSYRVGLTGRKPAPAVTLTLSLSPSHGLRGTKSPSSMLPHKQTMRTVAAQILKRYFNPETPDFIFFLFLVVSQFLLIESSHSAHGGAELASHSQTTYIATLIDIGR